MVRRLSPLVLVVGVLVVGLVLVACGDDEGTDARPATTTSVAPTSTVAAAAERRVVVVDLKLERRPESELTAAEFQAQQAQIDVVMDQVLKDLGEHGEVSRRLAETGQLAVAVDSEGEQVLSAHPLVGSVGDDSPERDRPSGGSTTTGPAAWHRDHCPDEHGPDEHGPDEHGPAATRLHLGHDARRAAVADRRSERRVDAREPAVRRRGGPAASPDRGGPGPGGVRPRRPWASFPAPDRDRPDGGLG